MQSMQLLTRQAMSSLPCRSNARAVLLLYREGLRSHRCRAGITVATTMQQQFLGAIGDARGVQAADRLCEACVGLLDVDAAAISLVFDGANVGTLGASDPRARTYDELQFIVGEGPCLDSVARRRPVLSVIS
jgi:hypothetical protein